MRVIALVGEQISPVFELSGMEVISPKDSTELLSIFNQIVSQKNIAMVVISARYAMALKQEIDNVRASNHSIVILEISSSKGEFNAGDRLIQQIKQTIGLS